MFVKKWNVLESSNPKNEITGVTKQFEYILNLFTLRFGFEKIILFHTD